MGMSTLECCRCCCYCCCICGIITTIIVTLLWTKGHRTNKQANILTHTHNLSHTNTRRECIQQAKWRFANVTAKTSNVSYMGCDAVVLSCVRVGRCDSTYSLLKQTRKHSLNYVHITATQEQQQCTHHLDTLTHMHTWALLCRHSEEMNPDNMHPHNTWLCNHRISMIMMLDTLLQHTHTETICCIVRLVICIQRNVVMLQVHFE